MKAEIVRDDLEISLADLPPGHDEHYEWREIKRNRKMVKAPFWKRGGIVEHEQAHMLVEMGCAVPADEECAAACGMTPDMIRAAMKAQDKVALGIHPSDYAAFDAGEMVGYLPDGMRRPGPNFKPPKLDGPLADEHD